MRINRFVVSLSALLAGVCASAMASTTGGRFFPDAPAGPVQSWGGVNNGAPREVNFDVEAFDKQRGGASTVGTLRFSYDTYIGRDSLAGQGGAILSGGFYPAANWRVKDGLRLTWVQTVEATTTGANAWNLPSTNAGRFPDTTNRTDPRYPFETVPTNPADIGAPSLGYGDLPGRRFSAGNQIWRAELALVAISDAADAQGFRTVNVIGSFLWGFSINTPANTVTGLGPAAWGMPTSTFLNTLNSFWSGNLVGGGGSLPPEQGGGPLPQVRAENKFRFLANTNVFIPTPGTIGIMALAGVAASRRRRAA